MFELIFLLVAMVVIGAVFATLHVQERRWLASQGGSTVPLAFRSRPEPGRQELVDTMDRLEAAATHVLERGALSERATLTRRRDGETLGTIAFEPEFANRELAFEASFPGGVLRVHREGASGPVHRHALLAADGRREGQVALHANQAHVFSRHARAPSWLAVEWRGQTLWGVCGELPGPGVRAHRYVCLYDEDDQRVVFLGDAVGGLASRSCAVIAADETPTPLLLLAFAAYRGLGRIQRDVGT